MGKTVDILISPPAAFLIFLVFFSVFYVLAGRISAAGKASQGKVTAYACGEDIPGFKFRFGFKMFFLVALFFTIMHVAALVVATVPGGPLNFLGIVYLTIVFLGITALVIREKQSEEDFSDRRPE